MNDGPGHVSAIRSGSRQTSGSGKARNSGEFRYRLLPAALVRRAYTLTELLVVVSIVVILMAATLPVAKRIMDDSRTRDSARLLAGNFQMARTYAARNNRPFGLWFELEPVLGIQDIPAAPNPPKVVRQCTQVYLAEVPPPYGGGTTNARGVIRVEQGQPQTLPEFNPLTGFDTNPADGYIDIDTAEKAILLSLIDEGDTCLVKFEYKGDWFRLIRGKAINAAYPDPNRLYFLMTVPGTTAANWVTGSVSGSAIPPNYNFPMSIGFRYQILRTPRRVGNPIEMIAGTCIDLEYSGMSPTGFDDDDTSTPITSDYGFGQAGWQPQGGHLVVMFAPGGQVDGLVIDHGLFGAAGTIHFLVGKIDKLRRPFTTPSDGDAKYPMTMFDPSASNLADVNSVWVSVGRLSGQVMTAENLVPPVDVTTTPGSVIVFPTEAAVPAGRRETLAINNHLDRVKYVKHCREAATAREQMGGQ